MPPDVRPTSPSPRLPRLARAALVGLPRETRFALYRRKVDCDATPDRRLTLGIAATEADLEACFALLHDAYVASGFMRPDPSGLRVTPYHALPTTTTLFARFDDQIIGTLSIIREGLFGFPLQSVFDLSSVRMQPGRIAEISALAIHPRFRSTGGSVLFPLMKFMYEYCTRYFDTRHLVIAVNPKHIEMYEALLFFQRLQEQPVANYDFVNGAPAVGATLDLARAPEVFRAAYGGRPQRRNMHYYFTQVALPNIEFPKRRYYTTNDPVMSPALLDHFFNRRTQAFDRLDERRRRLLHEVYPEGSFRAVLPKLRKGAACSAPLRRHHRYSLNCPGRLHLGGDAGEHVDIEIIDASRNGFLARTKAPLPERLCGAVNVRLGARRDTTEDAIVVRSYASQGVLYSGFRIERPGIAWQQCIAALGDDRLGDALERAPDVWR